MPVYIFLAAFTITLVTILKGLKHVGLDISIENSYLLAVSIAVVIALVGAMFILGHAFRLLRHGRSGGPLGIAAGNQQAAIGRCGETMDRGYSRYAAGDAPRLRIDDGNRVVTTEETQDKTIKIWDISDMASGTVDLMGEYLAPNGLAHNAHVMGDLLFVAHYSYGVVVVDISDPTNPVEVAHYDTYEPSDDGGFIGCWGVYPYTDDGYVYASDFRGHLTLMQLNEVTTGVTWACPLSRFFAAWIRLNRFSIGFDMHVHQVISPKMMRDHSRIRKTMSQKKQTGFTIGKGATSSTDSYLS